MNVLCRTFKLPLNQYVPWTFEIDTKKRRARNDVLRTFQERSSGKTLHMGTVPWPKFIVSYKIHPLIFRFINTVMTSVLHIIFTLHIIALMTSNIDTSVTSKDCQPSPARCAGKACVDAGYCSVYLCNPSVKHLCVCLCNRRFFYGLGVRSMWRFLFIFV